MRGPIEVHRELLAAQVAHEVIHLPRRITAADDLPRVLGLPPHLCLALRFYRRHGLPPVRPTRSRARLLAVAVPAGGWPDVGPDGEVHRLLSARPRPAQAGEVSAVTDYQAAFACPVGLPDRVRLFIDALLAGQDVLYCPAGDNATALGIRAADLLAVTGAAPVPLQLTRAPVPPSQTRRRLPGGRRAAGPYATAG